VTGAAVLPRYCGPGGVRVSGPGAGRASRVLQQHGCCWQAWWQAAGEGRGWLRLNNLPPPSPLLLRALATLCVCGCPSHVFLLTLREMAPFQQPPMAAYSQGQQDTGYGEG